VGQPEKAKAKPIRCKDSSVIIAELAITEVSVFRAWHRLQWVNNKIRPALSSPAHGPTKSKSKHFGFCEMDGRDINGTQR
jgi:hypothetical protein